MKCTKCGSEDRIREYVINRKDIQEAVAKYLDSTEGAKVQSLRVRVCLKCYHQEQVALKISA